MVFISETESEVLKSVTLQLIVQYYFYDNSIINRLVFKYENYIETIKNLLTYSKKSVNVKNTFSKCCCISISANISILICYCLPKDTILLNLNSNNDFIMAILNNMEISLELYYENLTNSYNRKDIINDLSLSIELQMNAFNIIFKVLFI